MLKCLLCKCHVTIDMEGGVRMFVASQGERERVREREREGDREREGERVRESRDNDIQITLLIQG